MTTPGERLKKGIKVRELDDLAILKCDKDGMELLMIPENPEDFIDINKLDTKALESYGIRHGILDTPIFREDGSIVVARGTPPQNGRNSVIEYHIPLPGSSGQKTGAKAEEPELYQDPKQTNQFVNVHKDQVIAVKIPPTPGTPGKNLFAEEVPATPGQWIPFKIGEGVEVSGDDLQLKSTINGIVILDQDGKIHVKDEWVIEGPVDISTGHVTFWGRHLEINGSVMGGMKVETKGNLTINGTIEDEATVTVKGNLEVKGIVRAQETSITVKKSMKCKSIERSEISVQGNLEVEDYILDARCRVGGSINILHGKGLLLGGKTYAAGSLTAKVLGGSANVPTLIHVGYAPHLEKELEKLIEKIENTGSKITYINDGLWKLKMMERKGRLSQKTKAIKTKLVNALKALEQYQTLNKKKLDALQVRMTPLQSATVTVHEKAHANTKILIDKASLYLNHDVEAAKFKFEKGEVVSVEI